jgi:hypothetical protein
MLLDVDEAGELVDKPAVPGVATGRTRLGDIRMNIEQSQARSAQAAKEKKAARGLTGEARERAIAEARGPLAALAYNPGKGR